MMFIWIVIVALFLLFSSTTFSKKNDEESQQNQAGKILKERYAQGEISQEEFLRMKKTLGTY